MRGALSDAVGAGVDELPFGSMTNRATAREQGFATIAFHIETKTVDSGD